MMTKEGSVDVVTHSRARTSGSGAGGGWLPGMSAQARGESARAPREPLFLPHRKRPKPQHHQRCVHEDVHHGDVEKQAVATPLELHASRGAVWQGATRCESTSCRRHGFAFLDLESCSHRETPRECTVARWRCPGSRGHVPAGSCNASLPFPSCVTTLCWSSHRLARAHSPRGVRARRRFCLPGMCASSAVGPAAHSR